MTSLHRKIPPNLDYLRKHFSFNKKSGVFVHRATRRGIKGGQVAGSNSGRYVVLNILKEDYYAHHLAWYYVYGTWPEEIDHKNRNRKNNSIKNLRPCTRTQNLGNTKGWGNRKLSMLPKGVFKSPSIKNPYKAQIYISYKAVHLGCFKTIDQASQAYKKAAKRHFGKFAA